jgi:CheY-like chemotaxis protein
MKIRARILVADDHEGMRERVHNLLGSDFEVVAAVNDGQAAVDATARLKPDLVLLDILMPKMDGIRAAQELKRLGHGVKVVFLSVQQDQEFVAAAFESGAPHTSSNPGCIPTWCGPLTGRWLAKCLFRQERNDSRRRNVRQRSARRPQVPRLPT